MRAFNLTIVIQSAPVKRAKYLPRATVETTGELVRERIAPVIPLFAPRMSPPPTTPRAA